MTLRTRVRQVARGVGRRPARYEDYDTAWTLEILKRTGAFFDIGCNVGHVALDALRLDPSRQVVLADANADALAEAGSRLLREGYSQQLRFLLGFVGDSVDEELTFWTTGTGAAGSRYPGHAVAAAAAGDRRMVTSTTLDRVTEEFGIVPDFVKVDVEGAEAEVLEGGRGVAEQHPLWLIEMHSNPELPMIRNAANVLEWCNSLGYRAWYLSRRVELVRPEQLEQRDRCHLLLVPNGGGLPRYLEGIPQGATPNRTFDELIP